MATLDSPPLILGAVAYDPKVVTIWEGFREYFSAHGLNFDYVLFSNYERQVEAHFRGHIDVAWNSPLAWLQSQMLAKSLGREVEALCMRDSDRDLTSVLVVRGDSPVQTPADLRGRKLAVGAADSPQATLIPMELLTHQELLPERDYELLKFDRLVGKHGDHIGGERDAAQALMRGQADVAAMLDSNLTLFSREGTLPPGSFKVLAQTLPYDHCNLTAMAAAAATPSVQRLRQLLLEMSYADPRVRPLLDLEGLKRWLPGRTSGYQQLAAALTRFHTADEFVSQVAARCR